MMELDYKIGLPKEWKWVKLDQIAKWGSGGTPLSTNPKFYNGNIPWLIIGDLNDGPVSTSQKYITEIGLANSSAKMVPPESVLIAMYGSIGKLGINKIPLATNQAIAFTERLNVNVSNKYLFYYLFHIRSKLHSLGKGGTQKNISQTVLKQVDFPLAPINTQLSIISKLEELFSELDKGIESLKVAQQQLKVYRQSVLKWAFEGRLTNENVKNGELPKGWKIVNVDYLLSYQKKGMATGPFGTMLNKGEHTDKGIPVLGIENIGEGVFQMPNKIFISLKKALELRNFKVKENDIIISRSGTVGEICSVPKTMEDSIISTNLIKVSLNKDIIRPKLFVYLFQGGAVRQQVFDLCKGSSRAFLNQTILKSLSIPYCALSEQDDIIESIENSFSIADKMEESITQSLQQAEVMRQSILKSAFEGNFIV